MALYSQGAVNASGLIHSLDKLTTKIWEEARELGEGTGYVNRHPIIRLFVEQLVMLCEAGTTTNGDTYSEAYRKCEEMAK